MMTALRTSTDIPDDPIGAYARQSPPVFSQIHVPEISKINTGYLKSLPGILKLTTIVSNISILICGLANAICWKSHSAVVWADIIAAFGLTLTSILLTLYLLRITETFSLRLPWWRLFEMIYLTAWAFWHLTVGISLAYYSDKTCTWFPSIHNNPIKDAQGDVYYGNIKLVSCGFTLNLKLHFLLYQINYFQYSNSLDRGYLPVASFFGFLACIAYTMDDVFTYIIWKAETRTSTTVAVGNERGNETTTAPTGNVNPQPVPA